MLSLFRIFFLLISPTLALAGSMGPVCVDKTVTVPCYFNAWVFDAEALYIKSAYSANIITGIPNASGTLAFTGANMHPSWGGAFKLEGSYLFGTGHDLTVNWYYYSKASTDNYIYIRPKWEAINIELGQYTKITNHQELRIFGGLHLMKLSRQTIFPFLLGAPNQFNRKIRVNAAGGRIGMDFAYKSPIGIDIYTKGAASLIVGSNESSNANNFAVTNKAGYDSLIPELELKLGLKYTYELANDAVTIDAGFLWLNYFNAFFELNPITAPTSLAPSYYGVYGPYVGIKFVGNI